MNSKLNGILLAGAVLSAAAGSGCVQSRPSRNGVFNENQYVRKSFLIRPGDGGKSDPGWYMKATVTAVSTPNPLGGDIFVNPGLENGGALVRFQATEDKLNLLNMREIANEDSNQRTPEIVNAWPVTNVDLKYRVNLDGETTNFLEENQELDWQQRQWVKVKFAKNDASDFAPLPFISDMINRCADVASASTTLVPNSFYVDEPNDYMQWTVQIALPLRWDDATCLQAYGNLGNLATQFGRTGVTVNLMYSMMRAKPMEQVTYQPLEVAEKDAIRHKYGFFETIAMNRDEDSGLLAARELVNRYDPTKPINFYFAQGFPDKYKAIWTGPGGIAEQTNKLFTDAGVAARVTFRNFDEGLADGQRPREYGDVRYSFIVWVPDRQTDSFYGLGPSMNDPRTGETLSSTVVMSDAVVKDTYVQRIDAYLDSIGVFSINKSYCTMSHAECTVDMDCPMAGSGDTCSKEWPDLGACQDGDVMPIVPAKVAANHNGKSSLFNKMQAYLQKPDYVYGSLGPQDFIQGQDADFFGAYFQLLPYYVFADPDMNPFVVREGGAGVWGPSAFWKALDQERQFQEMAAKIDRGQVPYDVREGVEGVKNATAFLNQFKSLTLAHRTYEYAKKFANRGLRMRADGADAFSLEQLVAHDARHCIAGKWETKQQWMDNLLYSFWSQVSWHEFGHNLGLTHNFMGSIDRNNFPTYKDAAGRDHIGLYANSVMEYPATPADVAFHPGWGPYDAGAIAWMYANTKPNGAAGSSISGQASATQPWKDPKGFTADGKETQFLMCNEFHEKYTPFCRPYDFGTTPSEIIANQIDSYEWQYQWRNFRKFRKFWDESAYANVPAQMVYDLRRFLSLWVFDWSTGELADSMRRIGITNPDPNGSNLQYYNQLTDKFSSEISTANQMVAAFHKAVIQQSSGERPYSTIYDKFYGDVTQQGIILDKLFAMQGWTALWPTDNYDQNQAGAWIASYEGLGDASYNYIAYDVVTSMIGGQYDVYPYFVPLAVAQFAMDTHDPAFSGRIDVRDWVGGHVFYRLDDFLTYFRDLAVQNNYVGCTDVASCTYDPRPGSDSHNEFLGPDKRAWIWAFIPDRNSWVAVQKERNTASYIIVRNYTDDVVNQLDDGAFPGAAYSAELPMKYFLDSFNLYN